MGAAEQPVKGQTGIAIFSRDPKTREDISRLFAGLNIAYGELGELPVTPLDMSLLSQVDTRAKLVVLDLENWVPSDELALNELRGGGYAGPVIVLTKRLDEAASVGYAEERVIFYDRANGIDELLGIGKRLIQGALSHPRKHPRHFTNEHVELRIDGNATTFMCKLRNLSKGGALIEVQRSFAIGVGDLVIMRIHLTQLNRVYNVRARVAWVKMPRLGVEFIADAE